jgi:hypothetical protein
MNGHFIWGNDMKYKIEKAESKKHEAAEKHYVVEKDFQKELKRVNALHKELKEHERMSMAEAHPIPALRK